MTINENWQEFLTDLFAAFSKKDTVVYGKSRDFMYQMSERFEEQGEDIFLSNPQKKWLKDIADKYKIDPDQYNL